MFVMSSLNLDAVVETLLNMFYNIVEHYGRDKVTLICDAMLQVLY